MELVALSDVAGTEVRGVDLTKPLSDAEITQLRSAYAETYMVLVREQELSRDDHVRFAEYFWPITRTDDGSPAFTAVSNVDVENDGTGTGVLLFHNDEPFRSTPALGLSLYANDVSADSSPTAFANGVRVLDQLDSEVLARISSLTCRHVVDLRCIEGDSTYRVREVDLPPDAPLDRYPRADHPVLYPVDPRGQEALFVSEHQASHLVGLDLEESEALLKECFKAFYDPSNVHVHRWDPGDVLVWNNLALQHGRPTPVGEGPRDFWRLKSYAPPTEGP